MKIAYIGTYPPRECGIGTFTHSKFRAMITESSSGAGTNEGMIIPVNDGKGLYSYPDEVRFTINQEQQGDYIEAAKFINTSGADICILEHEYGIFGGQSGVYILPLLHRLKIPFIAVLHTVVKIPSYIEKVVLAEISKMAAKTVVMSHKAVEFLTGIYGIAANKTEVIEHGVPDLQFDKETCKKEFKLTGKKVMLTFGLISRNKGIETVIKALPPVVAKYPDVVYIVLGKTHPYVLRHSGEEYRNYLAQLVKQLGLENNVIFMNEFADERKLFKYLSAADVYVTPYLSEAQITSGTLSYAVGAGCAVISTPYWHASELLADGRGRLFDFNNHTQLSTVLLDLFDHPAVMAEMQMKASAYRRGITWPKTGEKYINLAKKILHQYAWKPLKNERAHGLPALPPFAADHVKRLTDNTGILQHAKHGIPNLKEGYCLDDNARALLMAVMACKQKKHQASAELLPVYLSYIHYMQNDDGTFRNFLSFSRNFLDTNGSEDAFGRTIWALGYLLGNPPGDAYYQPAREMFFKAAGNFGNLQSVRGIANTIIGICHYLQSNPSDIEMTEKMQRLAQILMRQYSGNAAENWKWFEGELTYDNALLPLAMLHAASILHDEGMMHTGMESLQFLSDITLANGYLSIIGNEKWYAKDGAQSVFAQQPIDVMGMVLLFQKAFQLTKDEVYLNRMHTSFMWFFGENDLRLSLYDPETRGCCDGLESFGVNRNQGAESTLAFLISHLAVLQTVEDARSRGKEEHKLKNMVIVNGKRAIAAVL